MRNWFQSLSGLVLEAAQEAGLPELRGEGPRGEGWAWRWKADSQRGAAGGRSAEVEFHAKLDPFGESVTLGVAAVVREAETGQTWTWDCFSRLLAKSAIDAPDPLRLVLAAEMETAGKKAREGVERSAELRGDIYPSLDDPRSASEIAEAAVAYGPDLSEPALGHSPATPDSYEVNAMTTLLRKAFERATKLPGELQNEIALQLLEDIEGELRWEDSLARSPEKLEEMADRALEEFKAGRTRKMGFDDL